ncbi:phage regulatory CII family protein [Mycoplana ramosa]|uniref:Phage regulatory CII family protein n=1 Tax=Mycoplana ramosa TaxID=40837 RepID=A0ABW3YWM0_MYCRA
MSDATMYRLKAAQRDLVEACGGVMRAAEKCGYSKSNVGRWFDPNDPTLMPLPAVITLEAECQRPFVTAVMAEANGRRLADPHQERAADVSVLTSHAEVMRQASELMNAMALAMEDGRITPAEATTVDRIASALDTASANLRSSLATVKARQGAAARLHVVGGEGE